MRWLKKWFPPFIIVVIGDIQFIVEQLGNLETISSIPVLNWITWKYFPPLCFTVVIIWVAIIVYRQEVRKHPAGFTANPTATKRLQRHIAAGVGLAILVCVLVPALFGIIRKRNASPLVQSRIEVVSYNSMNGISIYNKSESEAFIVDIRVVQVFETIQTPLRFTVESHRTAASSWPNPNNVSVNSLPMLSNTWLNHMEKAVEIYKRECLLFVYFSMNDPTFILLRDTYAKQGQRLAMGGATGTVHYRLSDAPETQSEDFYVIATTMNKEPCGDH